MNPAWPRAWGEPVGTASIRCLPEDFRVSEELGFELSGSGEHVFLYLQKRNLNSAELLQRVAGVSGVARRDIGISGLKDRHALTRQWVSVGLAGRPEPDWRELERAGDVQVLHCGRHLRKLKRGVHRANRFSLVLRALEGDRQRLAQRLQLLRERGVPNYFGEQRFGRNGATLEQARHRAVSGGGRLSRQRRSLYFSALRAFLFNTLLAARVEARNWNEILPGDVCLLRGSRSLFTCEVPDEQIVARARRGDLHPGLPMWGEGVSPASRERAAEQRELLQAHGEILEYLQRAGLTLAWRPARLLPDDFCWEFCDDDTLQLDFALGAGAYATALLAELVQYQEDKQRVQGSDGEWQGC